MLIAWKLATLVAVKEFPYYYLNKFGGTVKAVFKCYYSPKRQRKLSSVSEILDEAKAHYGGLKTIRWLASRKTGPLSLYRRTKLLLLHN